MQTNTFTNLLTFTNPIPANVLTWDPAHNTTGSDGLGTWDTSTANWANNSTDVAWPNNGNDAAVLGTGATLASSLNITLDTPITVGNLTFNTGGTGNSTAARDRVGKDRHPRPRGHRGAPDRRRPDAGARPAHRPRRWRESLANPSSSLSRATV